jgi:hypothetical protein
MGMAGRMRLRRRPNPGRVRHALKNLPPSVLADEYGEEIVRLRGEMQRALDLLNEADPNAARRTITRALERGVYR